MVDKILFTKDTRYLLNSEKGIPHVAHDFSGNKNSNNDGSYIFSKSPNYEFSNVIVVYLKE